MSYQDLYGKCPECNDSGYINYEQAFPDLYGTEDYKVAMAKPCTNCRLGQMIAAKYEKSGVMKGGKDGA